MSRSFSPSTSQPLSLALLGLVLGLLTLNPQPSEAYRRSAQEGWTDSRSGDGIGMGRSRGTLAGGSDLRGYSPRGAGGAGGGKGAVGDKRLLNQALDAFHQASHLEKALKKSEKAVSKQTGQLRSELAKAKATAASTGQSEYFKKEEQLDEELMRQAERETRRDKRLVRQAEDEMKGDKKFLEKAYGVKNIDAQLDAGTNQCPTQRCHQAKVSGLSPTMCTVGGGSCPTIGCHDYINSGTCGSGSTICTKELVTKQGCKAKQNAPRWLKKSCPAMRCSDASALAFTPDFCTQGAVEGPCPQINCYHYLQMGGCRDDMEYSKKSYVCMKPADADYVCLSDRASRRKTQATSLKPSVVPRGGKTRLPFMGMGYTGMFAVVVLGLFITCVAGGLFILFHRYGGNLGRQKKPAPVPSYYGKL